METLEEHIEKVRAERKAREKARIEKLKELNLKKYNQNQTPNTIKPAGMKPVRNIFSMWSSESRAVNNKQVNQNLQKNGSQIPKTRRMQNGLPSVSKLPINTNNRKSNINDRMMSQHVQPAPSTSRPTLSSARSIPGTSQNPNRESVFDRLYKLKPQVKTGADKDKMIPTNSKCLKTSSQTINVPAKKRYTTYDAKIDHRPKIRRSISAVHFKRINKSELVNCIHKFASIGDKLHSVHLKDTNEDETETQDVVVSAVKSEQKMVKFMTPMSRHSNAYCNEEMQMKLKSWLQKRGKSFDSYHHLQCFGIHNMAAKTWQSDPRGTPKLEFSVEDNKENIAVESDSDDGSYMDNMEGDKVNKHFEGWRKTSVVCDSFEINESVNNTTMTSADTPSDSREVLFGALNDLTDLLKEGFEWEQCARWLRAVRERFPSAPEAAPYWECRAALAERRGDLPASMDCWEQAIAKGIERSVVEANLDQLLDKFMQLKISPNSKEQRPVDPKMVDIKNVVKSTIIRFTVQQGKLRQSSQESAKYTVTPVRRSGRVSSQVKRTPFRDCPSFKQFPQEVPSIKQVRDTLGDDFKFVPNSTLHDTP